MSSAIAWENLPARFHRMFALSVPNSGSCPHSPSQLTARAPDFHLCSQAWVQSGLSSTDSALVTAVPPALILSPSSNLVPIFYPSFDNWVFVLSPNPGPLLTGFLRGHCPWILVPGQRFSYLGFFFFFKWKHLPSLCKPHSIPQSLLIPIPSLYTHTSYLNSLRFPCHLHVSGTSSGAHFWLHSPSCEHLWTSPAGWSQQAVCQLWRHVPGTLGPSPSLILQALPSLGPCPWSWAQPRCLMENPITSTASFFLPTEEIARELTAMDLFLCFESLLKGILLMGVFQVALVVKNLPANAGNIRDVGLIPGLGRSLGDGHGNPFQYSCLQNPTNRGAWQARP